MLTHFSENVGHTLAGNAFSRLEPRGLESMHFDTVLPWVRSSASEMAQVYTVLLHRLWLRRSQCWISVILLRFHGNSDGAVL